MKTKTLSPNRLFLRFSETSPRSCSPEETIPIHLKKTKFRESVNLKKPQIDDSSATSFTFLRSQLNQIKSEVNKLLEEGPISKFNDSPIDRAKHQNSPPPLESIEWSSRKYKKQSRNFVGNSKIKQPDSQNLIELTQLKRELKESLERQKQLLAEKKILEEQLDKIRTNIYRLHDEMQQKNFQLLKVNSQLQQFIKRNFGSSSRELKNPQQEAVYYERLQKMQKNNENLAKQIEELKNQRQASVSNFQQKIAKMNQKYNCYIRKMKETYEKELKEKMSYQEKEKTNTEILLKEKSLEGSSDKIMQEIITRLNKQIKKRDKKIEFMFMEIIRLEKDHKKTENLQVKYDQQAKLIEDMNKEIIREKAERLGHKYGEK